MSYKLKITFKKNRQNILNINRDIYIEKLEWPIMYILHRYNLQK